MLPTKARPFAVGQPVITPVQRARRHPLPVASQRVTLQSGKPQPQEIQIVVSIATRPQVIQPLVNPGTDNTQAATFHFAPVAFEGQRAHGSVVVP
ncbi:hypothetical protein D3C80_1317900 [compost metagenome]